MQRVLTRIMALVVILHFLRIARPIQAIRDRYALFDEFIECDLCSGFYISLLIGLSSGVYGSDDLRRPLAVVNMIVDNIILIYIAMFTRIGFQIYAGLSD